MVVFGMLFLVTCFLAYSNGANDNFKGVATLFGSRTTDYKSAVNLATLTTFAGSVCSIFLAQTLIKNFSGKGLVPDSVAGSPEFLISVALGAALTVMLATLTGFPISTTHGLTGALAGAGFMAVGSQVNFVVLGNKFLAPLLLSPFVAVILGGLLYITFRFVRMRLGITKEYCVCVGQTEKVIAVAEPAMVASLKAVMTPDIIVDKQKNCTQRYGGKVLGISCQKLLDKAHFVSAGMVSFARGLNDTPKIVALLLALTAVGLSLHWGMLAVAVSMSLGGIFNARKVAETMSKRITPLNHGQGFTANVATAFLVICASRWGLPVSTTHASCGSIFGLGLATQKADPRVIKSIILAWVLTLPVATFFSAATYWVLT